MNAICRCIVNKDLAISTVKSIKEKCTADKTRSVWQTIYPEYLNSEKSMSSFINTVYDRTFSRNTYYYSTDTFEQEFQDWCKYVDETQSIVKCYWRYAGYSIVGTSENSKTCWLLPDNCLTFSEYTDILYDAAECQP